MLNVIDSKEFLTPQFSMAPYALFCFLSGIFSIAVLHLDKSLVDAGRASILRLTYDKPLGRMSWLWFRGAFMAALIGGALQIWRPSLYAAVVVGLTWQVLLNQFFQTIKQQTEPVQPPTPDAEDIRGA